MNEEKALCRWYVRCLDCLEPFAVEVAEDWSGNPALRAAKAAGCPVCEGRSFEVMGRVWLSKVVVDVAESPCDARCTNARGPSCDCHCGAKNHGSQLLIHTAVLVGKVRARAASIEKAVARAREWRWSIAVIQEHLDALDRSWRLDYHQGNRLHHLRRFVAAARSARSHATRMKWVAKANERINPPR